MRANATKLVLLATLLGAAPLSLAQTQSPAQPIKREIIPGSELMTSRERERYRQRMRGAKNPNEEVRLREEHIKQMQERARLRGLSLDVPHTEAAK